MCAWMHIIAIKSAWLDEAKSLCNFFTILCNIIWFKRPLISWSLVLQLFPKCRQFFSLVNAEVAGAGYSVGHTVTICTIWRHWRCTGRDGSSWAKIQISGEEILKKLTITSVELSCAFLWFFWDFIRISNSNHMELHCIDFSTMLHIYLVKSSP